ncbi:hypothetical protein B0T14DRAFT_224471 [Immersiella caudata]|uniref:Secreted protein n=1 Tax=Immersiella caudata TaxID=314043 RepID=A0AA39WRA4_9PEZI|nr:hypothetical protein B0T14DRAFT_224471 [Immersiella caudata]
MPFLFVCLFSLTATPRPTQTASFIPSFTLLQGVFWNAASTTGQRLASMLLSGVSESRRAATEGMISGPIDTPELSMSSLTISPKHAYHPSQRSRSDDYNLA